jgi:hypothetical protein
MPGGDKTGPEGRGPMTGRAFGYCAGYNSPGFTKGIPRGRSFGRGRARGRGFWRRGYYPEPYYEPAPRYREEYPKITRDEEKHYLEYMIKSLESELKEVKKRLDEINKEN